MKKNILLAVFFVEPVEKVDFCHQNTCNGTGNLI
jgi:hypothetical protein